MEEEEAEGHQEPALAEVGVAEKEELLDLRLASQLLGRVEERSYRSNSYLRLADMLGKDKSEGDMDKG